MIKRYVLFISIIITIGGCNMKKQKCIYLVNYDKKIRVKNIISGHQIAVSEPNNKLSKIMSIRGYNNRAGFLPTFIFNKYPNIEEVSIGGYQTIELNKNFEQILIELSNFKSLKKLLIQNHKINYIPSSIIYIDSLEYLDFRGNSLQNICNGIEEMKFFRKINLSENDLGKLDYNELNYLFLKLSTLENLETLIVSSNFLDTLPSNLIRFKNLKNIYLSDNYFEGIPSLLTNLEKLTFLSIDFDRSLLDFPCYIDNFKSNINIEFNNYWEYTLEDFNKLKKRYPNINWSPMPNK